MSLDYIIKLENALIKFIESTDRDPEILKVYETAKINSDERENAKKMQFMMVPIEAANIRLMGYDRESQQLRVQFTNGGLFQYKNISEKLFNDMVKSPIIGSYFSRNIRNIYKCVKLN